MEHVTGCQDGLSIGCRFNVRSEDITIATDDFFSLWIPNNQLFVTVVHGVKLVQIVCLSSASTGFAEHNLAQSSYLQKHVRRIMGVNDVNLVVTFVGHSQLAFLSQFLFK